MRKHLDNCTNPSSMLCTLDELMGWEERFEGQLIILCIYIYVHIIYMLLNFQQVHETDPVIWRKYSQI